MWRFTALGGLTGGLAAAPLLAPSGPPATAVAASLTALTALALVAARLPRARDEAARRAAAVTWLCGVALASATLGIGIGSARTDAIDAGALRLGAAREAVVRGYVTAAPRRSAGEVAVRVQTPAGRLLVEAPEPVPDLEIGQGIEARGVARPPGDWQRAYLTRLGIAVVLAAKRIEPLESRREGISGVLDGVRMRAEAALSTGTPERSASLLRGFVLGQDDRIDPHTVDDFKRSGLAHLLAVSGQNVVLLAVLATAVFATLGLSARSRLVWILVLIAVYVPVTGAGASIQRAGVMGAAGVVAALAGRRRSRWYALLLAAAVTLAIDPRATADVGWQLSFAAVAGILLFTAPLARLLAGPRPGALRRGVCEAASLTVAATLATAPLFSLHFGTVSLVSLPANLLAVPAEAPVMWLGMVAGAAGQLDWIPVAPITWLAGLLAAYIAGVAHWLAAPRWAQVELGVPGAAALLASYAVLGAAMVVGLRAAERRRGVRSLGRRARRTAETRPAKPRLVAAVALAIACLLAGPRLASLRAGADHGSPAAGLRIVVLDVGQGDSILLAPNRGDPVLVDAGPPEADLASILEQRGIDRLAALIITHPDSDHAGGAGSVLASLDVSHLLFARPPRAVAAQADAAGIPTRRLSTGGVLRSGPLRLRVLWPPRLAALDRGPALEPNLRSLVILARWGRFRMLLTGDAEAELAPVHPGPVDVLKVAHHGSDDAGLASLLEETAPGLAVISVGADNPYGHPTPATLATLDAAGVPVARTDLDGEVEIDVDSGSWSVAP